MSRNQIVTMRVNFHVGVSGGIRLQFDASDRGLTVNCVTPALPANARALA